MSRLSIFIGLAALILFLWVTSAPEGERSCLSHRFFPPSPVLNARVVEGWGSGTDGDTVRIGETRVRFWGINAPETSEAAGKRARERMRVLAARGALRCVQQQRSRSHNRLVARCYLPDG